MAKNTRKTAGFDAFSIETHTGNDKKPTRRPSIYTTGAKSSTSVIAEDEKLPEFVLHPTKTKFGLWAVEVDKSLEKFFVRDVPLAKVHAREGDERQVRDSFVEIELEELGQTILQNGLMKPPEYTYDADNDIFWIETGERRSRAAKLIKWETISAFVYLHQPAKPFTRQLIENVQSAALHPFEVMDALYRVKQQLEADGESTSVAAIAREIQKDRSWVQKHINLEGLEPELRVLAQEYDMVSDYQLLDTLRKIWVISPAMVRSLFQNKETIQLTRAYCVALLKACKSEHHVNFGQGFDALAFTRAEHIESALDYLSIANADLDFLLTRGPALAGQTRNYIDEAVYRLTIEQSGGAAAEGEQGTNQNAAGNATAKSKEGQGRTEATSDNTLANTLDTTNIGSGQAQNGDPKDAIEVDPASRRLIGRIKEHGQCLLDLTRRDANPDYAWFIRMQDSYLIRCEIRKFQMTGAG
jgi:ParB/RepB/Spo0J family partition protein